MKIKEQYNLIEDIMDLAMVYHGTGNVKSKEYRLAIRSADAIENLCIELRTCRNELCFRCGNYTEAHKGACDGCRWKDMWD